MLVAHDRSGTFANLGMAKRDYIFCNAQTTDAPMFLSLLLARFNRAPRFTWSPSINLGNMTVRSNLIPGALQ